MFRISIAVVALAACGGESKKDGERKSSDAVEKKFTLKVTAGDKGAGIPIAITVPPDWKEELSDSDGAPSWKVPNGGFMDRVGLVAFPCSGEAAACVDKVQGYQFGKEDMPAAKVEELGPGKRFVTHDAKDKNGERRIHARLFWHHAASKSVLMCLVFLGKETVEHAAAARKACDSVKLL